MADPLIEQTIKVWQPLSPTPLTAEDAAEIISGFSGFFSVLRRWQALAEFGDADQSDNAQPTDPAGSPGGHLDRGDLTCEERPKQWI